MPSGKCSGVSAPGIISLSPPGLATLSFADQLKHQASQLRSLVVLTGLPASGKSFLGRQLAAALRIPLFDKDAFLESLLPTRGDVAPELRTRLSREADGLFEAAVKKEGRSIAVSWWRHPRSLSTSGTAAWWLGSADFVEIHCSCGVEIAARRFLNRIRHPGHGDQRWTETRLLQFLAQQAALGPLTSKAIVVSTRSEIDDAQLATLVVLASTGEA